MNEAERVASLIASKAPIAIASAKVAINNGFDMDLKSASRLEVETTTSCFASEDKNEGMTAFLEKRTPEWKNK
jgi:enoyl-CoA hydratase